MDPPHGYRVFAGLSPDPFAHYSWVVKLAKLETILSQEDIHARAQLNCLACRRRLAKVVLASRFTEASSPEMGLSISNLSADLRDFQQTRDHVSLTCSCSTRSIYHLL